MTDILSARGCRWIDVPGVADPRGRVNFLELGKSLHFQPKRLFWLRHAEPGQSRLKYGCRSSERVLISMGGGCRAQLDDGAVKQAVMLDDPARALYIGSWVWHELTDFASGAAVVVIASAPYDEADYLRDYDVFTRQVGAHR
jgi:hypothetical protein